jgi:hypothetical protein
VPRLLQLQREPARAAADIDNVAANLVQCRLIEAPIAAGLAEIRRRPRLHRDEPVIALDDLDRLTVALEPVEQRATERVSDLYAWHRQSRASVLIDPSRRTRIRP